MIRKEAWYREAEDYEDKMPGGMGDKKTPEDFDPKAIEKGIKVEMEHTDSKETAREITIDHLTEDPKYYDKLQKMESGG